LYWGWGNCAEWSKVFATCILKASLYPLIVLIEKMENGVPLRHAIVGYWASAKAGEDNKSLILDGRQWAYTRRDRRPKESRTWRAMSGNGVRIGLQKHMPQRRRRPASTVW